MMSESLRRHAVEAGVGSDDVVVGAPSLDDRAGVAEVAEQMLVEAFVTEPAVEALGEPVLLRLATVGAQTLYIEPGSPWESGYCEGFNSKIRDELLNGEIFYSLKEAQILIEQWRNHYNTLRPHSALGYRPPAPQTVQPNIIHLDHAA